MIEIPYHNCVYNAKKHKKYSYGILCISRNGRMVINTSPPYIDSTISKKIFKQKYKYIDLNTNEKYNLDLALFPTATLEGEFSLPKGQMDRMDQKTPIFTKIREFIEETKYSHPCLENLMEKHFKNPKFKSFLNYQNFIIKEQWMGLNGIIYECEYSVFLIDSMDELIPVNNDQNIVPLDFFTQKFSIYAKYDKYHKQNKKNANLDGLKQTLFVPIHSGICLLNEHKINIYRDERDSRLDLQDLYKYLYNNKKT